MTISRLRRQPIRNSLLTERAVSSIFTTSQKRDRVLEADFMAVPGCRVGVFASSSGRDGLPSFSDAQTARYGSGPLGVASRAATALHFPPSSFFKKNTSDQARLTATLAGAPLDAIGNSLAASVTSPHGLGPAPAPAIREVRCSSVGAPSENGREFYVGERRDPANGRPTVSDGQFRTGNRQTLTLGRVALGGVRERIIVAVRDGYAESVGTVLKRATARDRSFPGEMQLRGERQLREIAGVGGAKGEVVLIPRLAVGLPANLAVEPYTCRVGEDSISGFLDGNGGRHVLSSVLGHEERNIGAALSIDDRRRAPQSRAANRQLRCEGRLRLSPVMRNCL